MPKHGLTRMFERRRDHPNIDSELGLDYHDVRSACDYDKLVFTDPIDEYFDYRFGKLPFRSLQFRYETVNQEGLQSVAVVNYRSEENKSELQSLMRNSYAIL